MPNTVSARVEFDDQSVRHHRGNGTVETLPWSALGMVVIKTTSGGPLLDDVIWFLLGADAGCIIPSETAGMDRLVARLQKLPGFDNMALIEAMGSTEDRKFLCWKKVAQGDAPILNLVATRLLDYTPPETKYFPFVLLACCITALTLGIVVFVYCETSLRPVREFFFGIISEVHPQWRTLSGLGEFARPAIRIASIVTLINLVCVLVALVRERRPRRWFALLLMPLVGYCVFLLYQRL